MSNTVGRRRVKIRGRLIIRNAQCGADVDRPGKLHVGPDGVYDVTTGVATASGKIVGTLDGEVGPEVNFWVLLDGSPDATLTLESVGTGYAEMYELVTATKVSTDTNNQNGETTLTMSWIGKPVGA